MRIQITHNSEAVQKAVRQRPNQVMRALDRKLERGAHEVAREARRMAPKAFSQLTNAIHIFRHGRADFSIFAATNYAKAVEEGASGGGIPSHQSLLDWIKVKRITPRNPEMDADDLAYVIGRSILAKGTPAQPFMQPALNSKRDRLHELVSQGLAEGLRA